MTEEELNELISHCPRLYHMAEIGAWNGIKDLGLLSTSALLDLYSVDTDLRFQLESCRRDSTHKLSSNGLTGAAIRDQLPMDDKGLRRALPADITPREWYEFLNKRVFFWLSEDRLKRLKNAKAYKSSEHEIIVVDTRRLVDAYKQKIMFCPINSGCTKPFPHSRDFNTFSRIESYPYDYWKSKRRVGERVVELCVDEGVPDLVDYVLDVYVLKGDERTELDWK
ncbi:DUF7002 family protein [Thalassospira tepidiphila]|uniref:DUF7002 family protein n=1 Tax=Thalassospira tepidiphila TaxID=393657 RepID=UPI003AA8452B